MSELEELKDQLKEIKDQLKEINSIIKDDYESCPDEMSGRMIQYCKKHIKPKDPLFEKFKDFLKDLGDYGALDPEYMYGRFQGHFKEELNGTKKAIELLDETIKDQKKAKLDLQDVPAYAIGRSIASLEDIRERLEGEQ